VARGKKNGRAFSPAKDRKLVLPIMEILLDGKPTVFCFEGACRHGLRSAFALQGNPWALADHRAGVIVAAALKKLGSRRPSWSEGQKDWCQPSAAEGERWSCIRCGGEIPEERFYGGRLAKWCSSECRRRSIDAYSHRHLGQMSRALYLALVAARRQQALDTRGLICETCGKKFLKRGGSARFCSPTCRQKALVVKACVVCGQPFRPRQKPEVETCPRAAFSGFGVSEIEQSTATATTTSERVCRVL
jgi:hypothetical protein